MACFFGLFAIGYLVVGVGELLNPESAVLPWLVLIGWVVAILAVLVRFAMTSADVREDGVIVRNPFGTHCLLWEEVRSVEIRDTVMGGHEELVFVTDERVVRSWAVQRWIGRTGELDELVEVAREAWESARE